MDGWTKMIIDKIDHFSSEDELKKWTMRAFDSHVNYINSFKNYNKENVFPFHCNREETEELVEHYSSRGMNIGPIEEFSFGIVVFVAS
ncbi:MAG: hypothetical protein CMP59_08650 [Flavobacteriales bacterium]|nr:hypothetical protein [Flavobacteriales bacterium]|tara:strand:+ start:379 stop:642 length:264 start_codon:yes stop_codon:yes gene_type:complete